MLPESGKTACKYLVFDVACRDRNKDLRPGPKVLRMVKG